MKRLTDAKKITLYLDKETRELLEKRKIEAGAPYAEIIRRAVASYLIEDQSNRPIKKGAG